MPARARCTCSRSARACWDRRPKSRLRSLLANKLLARLDSRSAVCSPDVRNSARSRGRKLCQNKCAGLSLPMNSLAYWSKTSALHKMISHQRRTITRSYDAWSRSMLNGMSTPMPYGLSTMRVWIPNAASVCEEGRVEFGDAEAVAQRESRPARARDSIARQARDRRNRSRSGKTCRPARMRPVDSPRAVGRRVTFHQCERYGTCPRRSLPTI